MRTSPTISFAIPTYNGSEWISQSIESVLSQIILEDSIDQYEIVVSDNASTDGTEAIIAEYVEKYPGLFVYVRNESNIGFDNNVEALFKKARGEYLWLLGDDDYLKPGSIKKMEGIIRTHSATSPLAVVLMTVWLLDLRDNSYVKSEDFAADKFCRDGNDFFRESRWASSAMSSLLIRRDEWNRLDLRRYYGSQWIHVGAIVSILSEAKPSYIVSEPMAVVRYATQRWKEVNGSQLRIGIKHLAVFRDMIDLGYADSTYHYYLWNRYRTNLDAIMSLKPESVFVRFSIGALMTSFFWRYLLFWIIQLPALLLPNVIAIPLVRLYKSAVRAVELLRT